MLRYPLRYTPLVLAVVTGACAGHRAAPASRPVPASGPATTASTPTAASPAHASAHAAPVDTTIPPAPVIDTTIDLLAELGADSTLAADSAADQAVLDRLARAHAPDSTEDLAADPASEKVLTNDGVRWDIDVSTFNSHDRVQYYLDMFRGMARDRFNIWLSRMPRYEPMIRARLQKQGLPGDLVYLALIESGFSNQAVSRARATGMWQFMKGTARLYGLRVDSWVDERRDPVRATDAAARFLSALYQKFGSVYLACAAYNAGGGKIGRSLNRLDVDEEEESDSLVYSDATFFRLYDTKLLHRETRDYVPKLIAAALIAKEPSKYGFAPQPDEEMVANDSIVVPAMTSLDVIARLADTSLTAIRELNPQYLRLATPPGVASVVRLPMGRGAQTAAAYASLPASDRVSFRTHIATHGETAAGVARRYGVSYRALLAANPGVHSNRLKPGTRLVVPTGGPMSAVVARQVAQRDHDGATYHRVRRGEKLGTIADRYDVSTAELRRWNHLGRHQKLRAGTRLRVAPPSTMKIATTSRTSRTTRAVAARAEAHPQHAKGSDQPADTSRASRASTRTHVVRRGETLTALARRYGVSIDALKQANGLNGAAHIRAGERIRIPA